MNFKLRFENIALAFVIIIGIGISIFQFLYNRSLWLDEANLALNIINRNFLELFEPLDNFQVAPVIFLQIEKLFTILIGNSEYGLRLFSLLCYWSSIFFIYKLLKTFNLNVYIIILGLSIFMFNGTVIWYSSEIKQYMTDVLVLTSMFYFTLKDYKNIKNQYYILGLIGMIGIFLSNVSPIILLCCGLYLFLAHFKGGWSILKNYLVIGFLWFFSFSIYFLLFIYDHPTRDFMLRYWTMEGAFMPINPIDGEFFKFAIRKYYMFYYDLFNFGWIGFYLLQILFLMGCYHLFEKAKVRLLIICISPILVHLILSSLKLYPFDLRLILYLCPAFVILLSFGLDYIFQTLKVVDKGFAFSLTTVCTIMFLLIAFTKLPVEKSEIKKCLVFLHQEVINQDKIYFTSFSSAPAQYYKETSDLSFPDKNVVYGEFGNYKNLSEQVNGLNGRVWFVFSDYALWDKSLMQHMKNQFKDGKHVLIKEYHPTGASVLLYDIKAK